MKKTYNEPVTEIVEVERSEDVSCDVSIVIKGSKSGVIEGNPDTID